MKVLKGTVFALAMCAGASLVAGSATAASAKTLDDCIHARNAVSAALDQNADSPRIHDAQRERRYGLNYCNNGMYKQGVAHYTAALKILGADKSGS